MQKQTQQPCSSFEAALKKIHNFLQQEQYSQCLKLLQESYFINEDQNIQFLSLRGYVLILQKNYHKALELFNQCLKKKPYHLTSKKRRALALEKLGEYDESLRQFQNCLYFEPQSKSIRNKIKRLSMNSATSSAKSQSVSSQGNFHQQKIEQKQIIQEQIKQQPLQKQKTQSVKFGNFEIIEISATQDSDEHFALIKQQLNKLTNKKPKKSILKDSMSAGLFKQKPKSKIVDQTSSHKISNQKNQNQQQICQIKEQTQVQESKPKPSIKKKSKSVTFKGDTNLQDFN